MHHKNINGPKGETRPSTHDEGSFLLDSFRFFDELGFMKEVLEDSRDFD